MSIGRSGPRSGPDTIASARPRRALRPSLRTIGELIAHFARRQRFFLVPFLIVLVLGGILLLVTSGLAIVAPFTYTLF